MNSLQIKFIIFIAVVGIITIGFAILIFRQLSKVAKKALEAKRLQEEYQNQLDEEQKAILEIQSTEDLKADPGE